MDSRKTPVWIGASRGLGQLSRACFRWTLGRIQIRRMEPLIGQIYGTEQARFYKRR